MHHTMGAEYIQRESDKYPWMHPFEYTGEAVRIIISFD